MNKIKIKTEKSILADIESGKYRDFYFIYNRKSTDDAENQKNSISYQKTENARFAFREKFPIAQITIEGFCVDGVISEKHSGFKENNDITFTEEGLVQYQINRPKFLKLVEFLSKGYFKGVVCLCWDRISRNKGDDTLIRKLMRNGHDICCGYGRYNKSRSGAIHMDIDGMFAQHHSRVTSEKITLTLKNAREKGICTYRAPIGYQNLGEMEHKPLDPERAPIIKQMFEYYATGDWSLSDLARYGQEQRLMTIPIRRKRTKKEMLAEEENDEIVEVEKVSKPVVKNSISRILTNPFYIGKIKNSDGKYIDSISHEALVSEELFNQVQAMLNKRKVSIHYTEKIDLPLRGIVRCASSNCERIYTPYIKKGIQYFYSRCVNGCENTHKSFNFDFIAKKVGGLISNLYFTDEEIAQMDARVGTDIALLEEKRQKELDQIERRKKKIREDLVYIRSNKLSLLKTGVYSPEALLEEENKLNDDLMALQNTEQVSDVAMHETMQDIQKLSELVKNVVPHYDFANPQEKEKIIRIIFSELYVSQDILQYKVKKGFECFENRFVASSGPYRTRTCHPLIANEVLYQMS